MGKLLSGREFIKIQHQVPSSGSWILERAITMDEKQTAAYSLIVFQEKDNQNQINTNICYDKVALNEKKT